MTKNYPNPKKANGGQALIIQVPSKYSEVFMKKKILLVEPPYKNKYPPLGLMKIATAHKLMGDEVVFCKGKSPALRKECWDEIYITTIFTFQWKQTVDIINYWKKNKRPIVGGIMASLMPDAIHEATGIKPHVGPYKGKLSGIWKTLGADENLKNIKNEIKSNGIDYLPPDYNIFENMDVPYSDILKDYYVLRSTKGCRRGCNFCAVPTIEPDFIPRIPLEPYISYMKEHGIEKRNLLLLDDNVLMSPDFYEIIDEIKDLGFSRGSKLNNKRRSVDFNQGLDIRLLNKKALKALSKIELRPLRLAFDDIALSDLYKQKIEWAIDLGFKEISSYILYNHNDSPSDLYRRLEIACELNAKHGSRIYSFPMKYIPCNSRNRKHLGSEWTRRQIRGVQCILNAKHGIAPTDPDFLRLAFGKGIREFRDIIQMPENYILYRSKYQENGAISNLKKCYSSMTKAEKHTAKAIISGGKNTFKFNGVSSGIKAFLKHYKNENE